jgi:hypothetical protein
MYHDVDRAMPSTGGRAYASPESERVEGSTMFRRLALLVPAAVCLMVLVAVPALAIPALAGSELPPPDDPKVAGVVVQPPGSTGDIAFTGANIRIWMVVAICLLVVGVTLSVTGRRRSANTVS